MLERLNTLLMDEHTSDIHLNSGDSIWVRAAGDMARVDHMPRVTEHDLRSLLSMWNISKEAMEAKGGYADFAQSLGQTRLRGHAYFADGARSINISLRRLPAEVPALSALGLPPSVHGLLKAHNGLVLVCGGTGSGKSTTLAAMINEINHTHCANIITLEDPIEFVHKSSQSSRIRQKSVGAMARGCDIESFAEGVRASLREDPDVIMVGEVRDKSTVDACLQAAQTGHLVLATLHTNSAMEAIERILSYFPGEKTAVQSVLASVVRGVVAQRLVPSVSRGRVLAAEVMISTPAIAANIMKGNVGNIAQAMESGLREGQLPLDRALLKLCTAQLISRQAALGATHTPENLRSLLEAA